MTINGIECSSEEPRVILTLAERWMEDGRKARDEETRHTLAELVKAEAAKQLLNAFSGEQYTIDQELVRVAGVIWCALELGTLDEFHQRVIDSTLRPELAHDLQSKGKEEA